MAHVKNGKGDFKYKGGITVNEYARIHKWLHFHYGKANKCENNECDLKSKAYQYAIRKGAAYEKIRVNFIMLCVSCHKRYDWKPEFADHLKNRVVSDNTREKIRVASIGKIKSAETIKKLSIASSGKNNPMYGVHITGENHSFFGKHHSDHTKELILNYQAKVNKEQVLEIRKLHSEGLKQKVLAKMYSISTASVCRIINNKRYKLWLDSSRQVG